HAELSNFFRATYGPTGEFIFPGYFPPHSSRNAKIQFVSQPTSKKQQRLVQAHMLIGPLVVNLRQIRSASAR
ncbi:hypothetical protein ACC720_38500, partial [Rhizobium ruizarguesonis]